VSPIKPKRPSHHLSETQAFTGVVTLRPNPPDAEHEQHDQWRHNGRREHHNVHGARSAPDDHAGIVASGTVVRDAIRRVADPAPLHHCLLTMGERIAM
jgi:hypothetical protein